VECDYFVAATTYGLFILAVTQSGDIIYSQRSYFDGCNVTNVQVLNKNLLFCTMMDGEGNGKMVTIDVVTEEQETIMPPNDKYFDIMDMGRVPGTDDEYPYFILHAAYGLLIVDITNKRIYNLSAS